MKTFLLHGIFWYLISGLAIALPIMLYDFKRLPPGTLTRSNVTRGIKGFVTFIFLYPYAIYRTVDKH